MKLFFITVLLCATIPLIHAGQRKSLDFPDELNLPQNQFKTPFCQSFAHIGLLEYFWYKKAKNHIKFSEKYMVKSILLTLAEKLWIESEQKFDTTIKRKPKFLAG